MSADANGRRRRIEWQRVRKDFPILERRVHGKPLTYPDSAPTANRPRAPILDSPKPASGMSGISSSTMTIHMRLTISAPPPSSRTKIGNNAIGPC